MTGRLAALPLAFALACAVPGGPASGEETGDSDTGQTPDDTGGDSGTDSGDTGLGGDTGDDSGAPDTDGDTGDSGGDSGDSGDDTADSGDSGEDSGDTGDTGGSSCSGTDLVLTAEVHDSAGVSGTSFSSREPLSMVAVLSNPCTTDVSLTTASDCLFTGWTVEDSRGAGSGVAVACHPVATAWTVPAGGTLEESQSWGTLRVDTYVLSVSADVPSGSAALKFSVI